MSELLPRVRKTLKGAGLDPAKRNVSSNTRSTHGMGGNYSTVSTQGFALSHETVYRQKKHNRTGRVVVDYLLSGWHPDHEKAANDFATICTSLAEAGFEAEPTGVPFQLAIR